MDHVFQAIFQFTDYVIAHFWRIFWSFIILMILWALVKSLLGAIITDTAEIFRKAFGRKEKRAKKKEEKKEQPEIPEPQPIMVAHPLDIKDEASRRLFEEEVEKEKEQMRLRAHTD
jgi:flagellar biosynthesis/type III secretory pathway M-ring protein FliF/YscJ